MNKEIKKRVITFIFSLILVFILMQIGSCWVNKRIEENLAAQEQSGGSQSYSVSYGSASSGNVSGQAQQQSASADNGNVPNGSGNTDGNGNGSSSDQGSHGGSSGTSDAVSGGSSGQSSVMGSSSGSGTASNSSGSSGSTSSASSGSGGSGSQPQAHVHNWSARTVKTGQKWVVDVPSFENKRANGSDVVCSCGINWGDDEDGYYEHSKKTLCTYIPVTRWETYMTDEIGHYEPVYGSEEYCTGCGAVK